MERLSVKNHKEFARFDYTSVHSNKVALGNIIFKATTAEFPNEKPEIGVVIQVHPELEDYRTDMFGNGSFWEGSEFSGQERFATLEETKKYRPELLDKLK